MSPSVSVDEHVQRLLDAAPPLIGERRERLAALLRPMTSEGAAATAAPLATTIANDTEDTRDHQPDQRDTGRSRRPAA